MNSKKIDKKKKINKIRINNSDLKFLLKIYKENNF